MTRNLFVYGTLKNPQIQKNVLGRTTEKPELAILQNYQLKQKDDYSYPIAVKKRGSSIMGLLIRDLSPEDFGKLNGYEDIPDGPYIRKRVTVKTKDGKRVHAYAYIGKRN